MLSKQSCLLLAAGAAVAACVAAGTIWSRPGPAPTAPTHLDAGAVAPAWGGDMRAALSAARTSGKDVLIEFAAPPGIDRAADRLDAAVFDAESFRAGACSGCVLVRLTSSADASPQEATRVATWGQRLNVTAFPTLAVVDSTGRACAGAASRPSDVAEALATVARLRQARIDRDASFVAAEHASGVERARLLDRALDAVAAYKDEYVDVMQQVADADPANAAGLRDKYARRAAAGTLDATIQNEVYALIDRGDLAGAVARVERLTSDAQVDAGQMQMLLAFEGQLYFSLGQRQRAVDLLDRAIALAPGSESADKVRAARAQIANPGA